MRPSPVHRVLESLDRRPGTWLALVLVLALVLRLALVAGTSDYQPIFDSADYDRHAQSIAAGDGYPEAIIGAGDGPSAFRPPAYPFLLGGLYAVTGDDAGVEAGRVLGAVLGVGSVFLIFLVARELGGRRAALIAAGVAAFFPPLALVHLALISEPLFVLLELGVILCILKARRANAFSWALAAGALCGLASLTRGNGLILVLVAAVAVWTIRPRFTRGALAAPLALCAAAALVIAPWTIRNAVVFDALVPISTQNGYGMAGAFNDEARINSESRATWILPELTSRYEETLTRADLNEAELDKELRASASDYLLDNPGTALEATGLNVLRVLGVVSLAEEERVGDQQQLGLGPKTYSLVRWSFIVVALAALASLLWLRKNDRDRMPPAFIWIAPAALIISAVWILGNTRYRIPLDPVVVVVLALGIAGWLESRPGFRLETEGTDPTIESTHHVEGPTPTR